MIQASVLLVDNDRSTANSIKVSLELEGMQVFIAASVECALQLASDIQFSVVVCNYIFTLPSENDLPLIMSASPHLYRVPFLVVTDKMDNMQMQHIMAAGPDDVISKPFNGKVLAAKVKRLAERAALHKKFYTNDVNQQIFGLLNKSFNQELLSAINGITNALTLSSGLPVVAEDADLQDVFHLIDHSCFRMLRNIQNITLYSQLQDMGSAKKTINKSPVDLEKLFQSIIQKYRFSSALLDKTTMSVIDTGEWKGNEEWIKVLLTELLDNALKFSDNDHPPEIKLHSLGGSLVFSASNKVKTLPGFDLKSVGPFLKFHNDLSRNGLGLGLYICKAICDQADHKLVMEARNRTVTFTLIA